jgi:hypothetical protein
VSTEVNLKSRESDPARGSVNPTPEDQETSLPLTRKVVPFSPAPAGVHAKIATIINPATKKSLFTVVDKFIISMETMKQV